MFSLKQYVTCDHINTIFLFLIQICSYKSFKHQIVSTNDDCQYINSCDVDITWNSESIWYFCGCQPSSFKSNWNITYSLDTYLASINPTWSHSEEGSLIQTVLITPKFVILLRCRQKFCNKFGPKIWLRILVGLKTFNSENNSPSHCDAITKFNILMYLWHAPTSQNLWQLHVRMT